MNEFFKRIRIYYSRDGKPKNAWKNFKKQFGRDFKEYFADMMNSFVHLFLNILCIPLVLLAFIKFPIKYYIINPIIIARHSDKKWEKIYEMIEKGKDES